MTLRLPQDPECKKRLKSAMNSSYLRSLPAAERKKWMNAAKGCKTIDDLPPQMKMHLIKSEEELLEAGDKDMK